MWLAYVKERPAYDLVSAVENLAQHFRNLEFDAAHESVYGMGQHYSYQECVDLANKYEKAVEACNLFLHTSDIETLLEKIKELKLQGFLGEVRQFVPDEIFKKVFNDMV